MNFIRAHYADNLDLDRLASVACLSRSHFSRVFGAHFQETPIEFLQRVRLEQAARRLAYTDDQSITAIAFDSGFGSSQSFSRAFRAYFGTSPRSFKSARQWSLEGYKQTSPFAANLYIPRPRSPAPECRVEHVTVQLQPAYRVAYIRHIGPFGDVKDSITETFSKLQWWAALKGLLNDTSSFVGVCAGDCSITPAQKCVYDACIVLDCELEEDDFVSIRTIPAGSYAILPVECHPNELNNKWNWLTSQWLPKSGRKLGTGPSYEMFAPPPGHQVRAEFGALICLPVSPAGFEANIGCKAALPDQGMCADRRCYWA